MELEPSSVLGDSNKTVSSEGVRSKWELVDYGDDSDEELVVIDVCLINCL